MAMALDFDHIAKVDQRLTELFHVCFVVFNPCMLPILGLTIEAGIPHNPMAFLAVSIHGADSDAMLCFIAYLDRRLLSI
jgi:hypothetical protein